MTLAETAKRLRDPEHERRLTFHFERLQRVSAGWRLSAGSAFDLLAMLEERP